MVFGNVMQDYDRASSEDMMAVMEMCREGGNVDLSNLPLRYQSTQPFTIDWCRMNVRMVLVVKFYAHHECTIKVF